MTKPVPSVPGRTQPAAWGRDSLSAYLDALHANRLATFANWPEVYRRLSDIDGCFATIVGDGWRIPARNDHHHVPALLLIRATGSFRASCEAALAGQGVETFIMIRALLEAAGYALHISRNTDLAEVWLRRHDDPDAAKRMKTAFTLSQIRSSIAAVDRTGAERFRRLYDDSIDFGAHPNERAITGNMTMTRLDPSSVRVEHVLMHEPGLQFDYGLLSVARAGVCALEILQGVFAPRFELLGVRQRLLDLRKGL